MDALGVRDSSRLGRLIRRRKPAAVTSSATRRLVFTVIDPQSRPAGGASGTAGREAHGRETEVDAIDLVDCGVTGC